MNKTDRATLGALKSELEAMQTRAGEIGEALQSMADEQRERFENLNEGLQASEAGQALESAADQLEEAASSLESGEIAGALEPLEELS